MAATNPKGKSNKGKSKPKGKGNPKGNPNGKKKGKKRFTKESIKSIAIKGTVAILGMFGAKIVIDFAVAGGARRIAGREILRGSPLYAGGMAVVGIGFLLAGRKMSGDTRKNINLAAAGAFTGAILEGLSGQLARLGAYGPRPATVESYAFFLPAPPAQLAAAGQAGLHNPAGQGRHQGLRVVKPPAIPAPFSMGT